MYILFFILLLLGAVITIFLTSLKQLYKRNLKIYNFCTTACYHYLIIILLKYGLDKIFKTQFYLPEPNTLFTTVGHLDKDILFWSTMGSSHLYNTITGCIEILAAVLLFLNQQG
ncbi:MAG: hypothetical protein IPP48_00540 [Chitinophagaceae bacterium]|nr:hypothetical protein [Chitinophagaceae bacterium]